MQRLLVSLLVVGACITTRAQQAQVYPRIETGAHTAKTDRIDVDADQRYLFSASNDKTARVWDLHTGKLLRILRPPIGPAEEGSLYAIAASPDGNTIAVGGFTGADEADNYPIYIFDRESGAIQHTINGLANVTRHLAFSQDGRYLVAGLNRIGIRIYETERFTEVYRDADYGEDGYWVEFDRNGRLVTTSLDGHVRLYSSDFHLLHSVAPPGGKLPFSARFSPDGKLIAVGFHDSMAVDIFSADDLSFRYTLQIPSADFHDNNLMSVVWSSDGTTVCGAGRFSINSINQIVCWGDAGRGRRSTLPVAGETVLDLRSLRDGGIAFCAGDGSLGVLAANGTVTWRADRSVLDYRADASKVSVDGASIETTYFTLSGNTWQHRKLNFSLTDEKLSVSSDTQAALRAPAQTGLNIANWEGEFNPTLNGRALTLQQNERSRSLAIAPDKTSFVLGTSWSVRKFTSEGKQIWGAFVPDVAWGVNITPDGRYVVANFGDGTIRWYSFDTGNEVLALFIDRDLQRWVAWTPDGFFTYKNGGDSLIGYQINHGPGQAGEFVKVDQLREVFYRPDLITRILNPGGAKAVIEASNRVGGSVSKLLAFSGSPPEIEVLSSKTTEASDVNPYLLRFRVKEAGGGQGRVVYRIDGTEIEGRQVDIAGTAGDTVNRYIPVGPGAHTLTVSAYNAKGNVEGRSVSIRLTGLEARGMPNLYVVSAGISHYSDASLNRGVRFAADDANLVAATFKGQEGKGLYQKVEVVPLPDSRATVKGIQAAVDQAAKSARLGDTFVLYLAGHGIVVDGEYYFVPYEAANNQADILSKGLNRKAIQELLKKIPTTHSVLILDTCHAGAIAEGWDDASEKGAIRRVGDISGHFVLAASNTDQIAIDGYKNHGVFTYALIEGLNKASSDPQGQILISGLAEYVQLHVPEMTNEKWHVEQNPLWVSPSKPFLFACKSAN